MKHTLLVMGLALGLCPVWAAAQVAADGGAMAEGSITDIWTEGGENAWATDAELSPNAAPLRDWVSALPFDFRGSSSFTFTTTNNARLWCTAPATAAYAYARLDIPDGRKIRTFRFWGFDNSSENMSVQLREVCLPTLGGADQPTVTNLAQLDSVGTSSAFRRNVILNPSLLVDAYACTYWAYVQFNQCEAASSMTLRKVSVEHTK